MQIKRIIAGTLALTMLFSVIPTSSRVLALDNKVNGQTLRCNIQTLSKEEQSLTELFSNDKGVSNILGTKYDCSFRDFKINRDSITETEIQDYNRTVENLENEDLRFLNKEVSLYNLDYSQKVITDKARGTFNLTTDEDSKKVDIDDWFYVRPKNGNRIGVKYTQIDNKTVTYRAVNIDESNWKDNAIPLLGDSGELTFTLDNSGSTFTYSYSCVTDKEQIQYEPKVIRGNINDEMDISSEFTGYSDIKIEDNTAYFYDGKSSFIGCVDLEPYSSKITCSNNKVKLSSYGRYYVPVVINKTVHTYVVVYTNNTRPVVSLGIGNTDYTSQIEEGVQTYAIGSSVNMNAWSLGEDLSFHKHIYKYADAYDYKDTAISSNKDMEEFTYGFNDKANTWVCNNGTISLSGVNTIKVVYNNQAPSIKPMDAERKVKVSCSLATIKSVTVYNLNMKAIFKEENLGVNEKTYNYGDILKDQPDGSYVIEVKSSTGKSKTATLNIDTTACTVNFENGAIYNRPFSIVFKDNPATEGIKSIIKSSSGELRKDKVYGNTYEYLESDEGKHTYKVTDSIGNVKSFTLSIDLTAPNPGLKKNNKGEYKYLYQGDSKTFTAKDNIGLDTITIDSKEVKVSGTSKKYTVSGYGRHKVALQDKAGNKVNYTVILIPSANTKPKVSVSLSKKKTSKKGKLIYKKDKITVSGFNKSTSGYYYEIRLKYKYKIKKSSSAYKVGTTKTITLKGASTKKSTYITIWNKAHRQTVGKSKKNLILWNKTHRVYKKVTVDYRVRTSDGFASSWSPSTTASLK